MSDSTSKKKETEDSADDVKQRYLLGLDGQDLQFNQVKCPNCKTVTPHQWLMVEVVDSFGMETPIELADKHKRLVLCQNCGNMRLIK